jgi:hypothetical protein
MDTSFEEVYADTLNSLIDKSEFQEDLTLSQIAFAKEYGFVMPNESLKRFRNLKYLRFSFIFNPSLSIKYCFYIIYIKIRQWKLKIKARRQLRPFPQS